MNKFTSAKTSAPAPLFLDGAETLSTRYPVWLCDVWGVVHNGVCAFKDACEALAQHRRRGGTVILITNAPRPSRVIVPQLNDLGVPSDCYDAIVSSGDVTRRLVELEAGRNVYHLGPEKDLALLEGLPVTFSSMEDAEVVLCSGLDRDEQEDPEDYRLQLSAMADRAMPMICANPDKIVRKGDRLLPCAGALAAIYEELGGKVAMAGKPYPPIYDECLRLAGIERNKPVSRSDVLAIGDGLPTDVKGAGDNGTALLFIIEGIHETEMDGEDASTLASVVRQSAPTVTLAGIMHGLKW